MLSRTTPGGAGAHDLMQAPVGSAVGTAVSSAVVNPVATTNSAYGPVMRNALVFHPLVTLAPQQMAVKHARGLQLPQQMVQEGRQETGRRSPRLTFISPSCAAPHSVAIGSATMGTPPAPCPVVYAPAQSPQQSPRVAMRTVRASTFAAI
jgi:hypothetical protein